MHYNRSSVWLQSLSSKGECLSIYALDLVDSDGYDVLLLSRLTQLNHRVMWIRSLQLKVAISSAPYGPAADTDFGVFVERLAYSESIREIDRWSLKMVRCLG